MVRIGTSLVLLAAAAVTANAGESWLPQGRFSDSQVRFLVCSYEGSRLARARTIRGGALNTGAARWACERHGTTNDFAVTFRVVKGEEHTAGVAVAFDVADWNRNDYLMIPAAVYNGNRFHALGGDYMPEFPRAMFFNPKLPTTISNDPRLAVEPGVASKIELLTGNASTPAICTFDPAKGRGRILLFDQRSRLGDNGVFVEENAAQDRATVVIGAPGVRERIAGFGGFRASDDTGTTWKQGDEITLRFRVFEFKARRIPDLWRKFIEVRESLTGPSVPRDQVPMSALAEAIVPRFKARWTDAPAGGFYLPENSPDFQLGWVSGFMQTPMLALGDPVERDHICRQLDFVTDKLQGKSGFFYGGITSRGALRADRSLDGRRFALTRKNADALSNFIKFFDILRAQGHSHLIRPEWERAAKRLAEAFASTWAKYGEFGQYLDPDTGEIAVFNSSGGVGVPAGLALAAEYFHEPRFLRVAEQAADFYYARDVLGRGFTGGYCGDISQDPDSESTFGFLESLMALYRATKDAAWLSKAGDQAALASTWVLSYDYIFPPESQIARLGCHMAGAVWASAQNKHAAPGICTSSGSSLFELFRATGNVRYAELLRDIQHAHVEATEMPGHPTCGTGIGASMERIQPTDAEGKSAVGNFVHTQNAWTELDGLMMSVELPGLYVRTDTGNVFAFDHVTARVIRRGSGKFVLQIENRTTYEADVSVFAEGRRQACEPLPYTAYLKWPRVHVQAGKTVRMGVCSNGTLEPIEPLTSSTPGKPRR
jgi:hypothetical protein